MDDQRYQALVSHGAGQVDLESKVKAEPGREEVSVRPFAIGLCGTDLEIIDGTIDGGFIRYPVVIGHEWSATVVTDPAGRLAPGTPIVVEGIVSCGVCAQCRSGATNTCDIYDEIGFTRDGGAAEYAVIPSRLVHPLKETVDLSAAALVEPAAVVLRGLGRTHINSGMKVLIVGDGTIALLAAHLVRLWSPSEITMLGRRREQSDLARQAGVTTFTINPADAGSAFDLAIEAAGSVDAATTALASIRRGGELLLLGLPPHGQLAAIPLDDVVNGDITILGSFSYTSSVWREMVALLNSAKFDPGFLITHRFQLGQWAQAVAALRGTPGPRGKVLLHTALT